MYSAALRVQIALALMGVALAHGADPAAGPTRAAPSRPGAAITASAGSEVTPLPATKFEGVDYVRAVDGASRLGFKTAWLEPGKRMEIGDPRSRAIFEAASRDTTINGLRVFLGSPVVVHRGQLYVSRIDFERCVTPLLRPGFGVVEPPRPRVIVIDPGHGGADTGASNPRIGLTEKRTTLDVALRLKKLLEPDGFRVVLTRSDDRLPAPKVADLAMRADIANREHADLFVSIHFNVVERDAQTTRGVEVYTFAPARQHAAEWWSALRKTDSNLETTDQPVNRFDHWSTVLCGQLHRELLQTLKTDDRGKKIAHWGVLRPLKCPGVLVEPAVISNDAEARKLSTPAFRQLIATALAAGIRDYVALLDQAGGGPPPVAAK
jgi:N-acetylmuramoyl-L-alanine amidase